MKRYNSAPFINSTRLRKEKKKDWRREREKIKRKEVKSKTKHMKINEEQMKMSQMDNAMRQSGKIFELKGMNSIANKERGLVFWKENIIESLGGTCEHYNWCI